MRQRPVIAFAGGPPRLNDHLAAELASAGYGFEGAPTVVLHSVDGPFSASAPEGVEVLTVGEEGVDIQRPFTPRELVRILDEKLGAAWRGGTTPMGDTADMGALALGSRDSPQTPAHGTSSTLHLAHRIVDAVPRWAELLPDERLQAVRASLTAWGARPADPER